MALAHEPLSHVFSFGISGGSGDAPYFGAEHSGPKQEKNGPGCRIPRDTGRLQCGRTAPSGENEGPGSEAGVPGKGGAGPPPPGGFRARPAGTTPPVSNPATGEEPSRPSHPPRDGPGPGPRVWSRLPSRAGGRHGNGPVPRAAALADGRGGEDALSPLSLVPEPPPPCYPGKRPRP